MAHHDIHFLPALTLLCRPETAGRLGAVSVPFLIVFIVNLNLNVAWLFAWDALNITVSMVCVELYLSFFFG